jgi:hypothetical protein
MRASFTAPSFSECFFSCLTRINNEFEWISRFVIIAYATTLNTKGNLQHQTNHSLHDGSLHGNLWIHGIMLLCLYGDGF